MYFQKAMRRLATKHTTRHFAPWLVSKMSVARVAAMRAPQMMCYQCEQTTAGKGCTSQGVCSKTPQVAGLQDLQVAYMKRLCQLGYALGPESALADECAELALESSFATLTNVNFDEKRFGDYLDRAADLASRMEQALEHEPVPEALPGLPDELQRGSKMGLLSAARNVGLLAREAAVGDEDLFAVVEMATYGLKGLAAYLSHAERLRGSHAPLAFCSEERAAVFREFFRIGSYLARAGSQPPEGGLEEALQEALGECLAVGALNLRVMRMLDEAHCAALGTPKPTEVPMQVVPGHSAILVSGHDMGMLHGLLQQSEGHHIDVYTHGEMLNAHSYPALHKFKHLKGHFGTHWGNQLHEFRKFPGAILMTSNCLRPPTKKYTERLWTAGPVGFPGIPHIAGEDFTPLLEQALTLPGFQAKDQALAPAGPPILTGFGHAAVMEVADKLVAAVKAGQVNHIFVVGGCDGTEATRSYFTDLASSTPTDSIILTMGCGKFRLNTTDHGTVAGLPRLLDMGQCNDAYSAIVVAEKLAAALGCSVHDLPLHFAVSWFEQKAVAVLLTLLHLELKNIRIGPAVPAFLTPRVAEMLNQKFGLKGILLEREDEDLAEMLQGR